MPNPDSNSATIRPEQKQKYKNNPPIQKHKYVFYKINYFEFVPPKDIGA